MKLTTRRQILRTLGLAPVVAFLRGPAAEARLGGAAATAAAGQGAAALGSGHLLSAGAATNLPAGLQAPFPRAAFPFGSGGDVADVRAFGAVGNGVADDTAAIHAARDALVAARGGVLYFPPGRYRANINLSSLVYVPIILQGCGPIVTSLESDGGVVLDLASSTHMTVKDLEVRALPGADIAILAARYENRPEFGTFHRFERVRLSGTPRVAGLYHVGAEITLYSQCNFVTSGPAPSAIVTGFNSQGPNDEGYASPNGSLLSPVSQFTTMFEVCRFVKTTADSGPGLEIGPNVYQLTLEHCYFNSAPGGAGIEFNWHGNQATSSMINVRECAFECNGLKEGQGGHGMRSAGNGTPFIDRLTVERNVFRQERRAPGYYDLDFGSTEAYLSYCRIVDNKSAWGGGYRLGRVAMSRIEFGGSSVRLSGAVSSGDAQYRVAAGHVIRPGDVVSVGTAARQGAVGPSTVSEIRTVTEVAGDRVSVNVAFAYPHPEGDLVLNSVPRVRVSTNSVYRGFAPPVVEEVDLDNQVEVTGPDLPHRLYFGPAAGATMQRQSAMLVNRPFADEPVAPERGALATCGRSGDWSTSRDLDGFAQRDFPAFYSDRWYALPLSCSGGADFGPTSIPPGGAVSLVVSVPGAAMGDYVVASLDAPLGSATVAAQVTAQNAVTAVLENRTGDPLALPAGRLRCLVLKH